ncbi:uncharacterized protein LOC123269178 [Cotesia glomerata]|uniref:Uncharacterized protein n=1 Tax=Cotesia glomerata TaxID=32391 RepID=A0AAV7I9C4_COTGL|nr:uncharacterized protein LOC123269178 [Cotesia glomerata]KAH0546827.1 hypothetical protein KQX54_015442 [Cotesia glomerata]
MFKRTAKDMNFTPSKKQRLSSSKSSEKENLSVDEDSGLGPEIDNESSSDEMATSFGSQNSHSASHNTNINSKTLDFDRDSQSSEIVTQRRTRSISLQDTNTMKKLVTHQPNDGFDKSPRKLSLRSKKIRQSSTPDIALFFGDAVDEQLVMSPQHDERSSMEVDEANDVFSQFSATQASKDNFNINTILETLEFPLKNVDLSKATPVKIQSQHLENGNEILLTDSSLSTSQTNVQATGEEREKEEAELTQDSLPQNSANDHVDLFNQENAEFEDESIPSVSSQESSIAEMPEIKKKRRRNGTHFTHIKKHTTPIGSNLVVDNYKPGFNNDRELIVNNITMPKDFSNRLFRKMSKMELTKKIIIHYYGRDRMPKIALKEPTRKYPGKIYPSLLVNDSQVQDIIDLYEYYGPQVGLKNPPLPFKKVRQIIGTLCSQIRNFY